MNATEGRPFQLKALGRDAASNTHGPPPVSDFRSGSRNAVTATCHDLFIVPPDRPRLKLHAFQPGHSFVVRRLQATSVATHDLRDSKVIF